jgi:hypothetical protein
MHICKGFAFLGRKDSADGAVECRSWNPWIIYPGGQLSGINAGTPYSGPQADITNKVMDSTLLL